ncbi:hypothetical protein [Methyloglobulus morosus]
MAAIPGGQALMVTDKPYFLIGTFIQITMSLMGKSEMLIGGLAG